MGLVSLRSKAVRGRNHGAESERGRANEAGLATDRSPVVDGGANRWLAVDDGARRRRRGWRCGWRRPSGSSTSGVRFGVEVGAHLIYVNWWGKATGDRGRRAVVTRGR
jgi:hypothetical protein